MMANWGQATAGGLGGAATGATIGSVVPVIGTSIGAGVGGIAGFLAGLFGDSGDQGGFKEGPNKFNPDQQKALKSILQQGQSNLQNPYQGFEPIEQKARTQFQSQSLPGLAERFTTLGGSDTRGSSDFAGMLSGAQSEFDQGLAALRAQYGQQNQDTALRQLELGLTPQTEHYYTGSQSGTGQQLFQTGSSALGNYFSGGGSFGGGGSDSSNLFSSLGQFSKGLGGSGKFTRQQVQQIAQILKGA